MNWWEIISSLGTLLSGLSGLALLYLAWRAKKEYQHQFLFKERFPIIKRIAHLIGKLYNSVARFKNDDGIVHAVYGGLKMSSNPLCHSYGLRDQALKDFEEWICEAIELLDDNYFLLPQGLSKNFKQALIVFKQIYHDSMNEPYGYSQETLYEYVQKGTLRSLADDVTASYFEKVKHLHNFEREIIHSFLNEKDCKLKTIKDTLK